MCAVGAPFDFLGHQSRDGGEVVGCYSIRTPASRPNGGTLSRWLTKVFAEQAISITEHSVYRAMKEGKIKRQPAGPSPA